GFGVIEIGTLTPRPQPGNPKKRLFRLKQDQAIVNRMGFNIGGVTEAVARLRKNKNVLIGGNIGKNKDTPNERAIDDYRYCVEALYEVVDYLAVNVSSPDTPHVRELHDKHPVAALLTTLHQLHPQQPVAKPILLKIASDLTNPQLLDIIDIVQNS